MALYCLNFAKFGDKAPLTQYYFLQNHSDPDSGRFVIVDTRLQILQASWNKGKLLLLLSSLEMNDGSLFHQYIAK